MFADVSDINVGNMYFFNFINKVFLKLFIKCVCLFNPLEFEGID
nr:MAG TPA: hypothetical protein [Caudoviricetes sp.]